MDEGYTVSTIRRRKRKETVRINGPTDAAQLLTPLIRDADREHFYMLSLSTKNHVLACDLISVGSLSASIVHPREVLKPAILNSAAAIVVAHNHPSGVPEPSAEDIAFSHRLHQCCELMGIRLLDHVIVCNDDFISLKEIGQLT